VHEREVIVRAVKVYVDRVIEVEVEVEVEDPYAYRQGYEAGWLACRESASVDYWETWDNQLTYAEIECGGYLTDDEVIAVNPWAAE
jgi:hypothetical protein